MSRGVRKTKYKPSLHEHTSHTLLLKPFDSQSCNSINGVLNTYTHTDKRKLIYISEYAFAGIEFVPSRTQRQLIFGGREIDYFFIPMLFSILLYSPKITALNCNN